MNNLKTVLPILIFIVLYSIGCDKIDSPNIDSSVSVDTSANPLDTVTIAQMQNLLIEDYTGHKCNNCPAAAVVAEDLHDAHPDRVIVASVHAPDGGFQEVTSTHPTEFKTEAGTEYASEFGISANPLGLFNRRSGGSFPGVSWVLASDWTNFAEDLLAMNNEAPVSLIQESTYNTSTNEIELTVFGKFFEPLQGDLRLIVFLIRDSMVSPQTMGNGSVNNDYVHHHVLSDVIGGTWGTVIDSDGVHETGDLFSFGFTYELEQFTSGADPTFDPDNISTIAFVCDRDTYEIFQAATEEL